MHRREWRDCKQMLRGLFRRNPRLRSGMAQAKQTTDGEETGRIEMTNKTFCAAMLVLGMCAILGRATAAIETTTSAQLTTSTKADVTTTKSQDAMLQKLVGRWVRPDGGYVIEVRSIDPAGKADAAYFNPGPIKVGTATAKAADSTVELTVELRDVNYPGSTYRLRYDRSTDKLAGSYYQAVAGETYEIYFDRMQ
jgi:uncharacterized protein (DUF2147 family)